MINYAWHRLLVAALLFEPTACGRPAQLAAELSEWSSLLYVGMPCSHLQDGW